MNLRSIFSSPRLQQLKPLLQKALPHLKNKYVITILLFTTWMLFIDQYDVISQIKMKRKLKKLYAEKEFYLQKIEEIKADHAKLFTDEASLEKFAREKYLMKRDNEEIFLIVRK